MTADETYNGWKNYPTWAVNMWLSNEEPLHRATVGLTRAALARAAADPIVSLEASERFHVSESIRDMVEEDLAPDLGATFAADLLGYALDRVDWYEIADAWIETAREQ